MESPRAHHTAAGWSERDRDDVIERLREANEALIDKVREAHQATDAMRRSEQHYRLLFDAIDEGFCIVEMSFEDNGTPYDYRFLEVNPAFEGQTGLRDAEGRTMRELQEGHEQHWYDIYGQVAKTGEPNRFTQFAKELDDRWYDVYAFPLGSSPPYNVGILFRDISKRRAAEEQLRELGERRAYLLELSDALGPLTDPAEIQETAARLLGTRIAVSRAYYQERQGDSVFVARDYTQPGTPSIAGRHRLSDYPVAEKMLRQKTATIADAERDPDLTDLDRASLERVGIRAILIVNLIKHGRTVASLAVNDSKPREWTRQEKALAEETAERTWAAVERARAEAALHETEARAQVALDAAGGGSFVWYPDEDRVEPDAMALELLGLDQGSVPGVEEGLSMLVHPDDQERYAEAMARAADPHGDGRLSEEIRIVRPDGEERWISITGQTRFSDESSRGAVMPGVVMDLTERKRAEEDVRREREEHERRDREFVTNAAHELRTPLAGIISAVDALDAGAKYEPVERERFLAHVRNGAERLARLSESLLLLARASQDETLPTGLVAARALLDEVAADLQVDDGVEVAIDAPATLNVVTNRGLLERVLTNLATNAAAHTSAGRIQLIAHESSKQVVFEVRDTGTGVDPHVAERAFDRFYRHSHDVDGFGLGLAIADQAATAIGGKLSLEPASGGGTVARLVLLRRTA